MPALFSASASPRWGLVDPCRKSHGSPRDNWRKGNALERIWARAGENWESSEPREQRRQKHPAGQWWWSTPDFLSAAATPLRGLPNLCEQICGGWKDLSTGSDGGVRRGTQAGQQPRIPPVDIRVGGKEGAILS